MAWWQWALIVWALFLVLFVAVATRRYRLTVEREKIAARGCSAWRWSQDGYVLQCKICKAVQYGGDDYDGGPDASGHVEAR